MGTIFRNATASPFLQYYGSIDDGRNVLISPISLKVVLGLLYEGASGATEREFQTVLNFPLDKRINRQRYRSFVDDLRDQGRDDAVVRFSSSIFLDSSIEPQQSYAATVRHYYDTGIVSTNFSRQNEASAVINDWIRAATNGKVAHLVDAGRNFFTAPFQRYICLFQPTSSIPS